jgi:hypothetical protein
MSVEIEFVHVPNGTTKVLGPFNFAQITYDTLRVENPDGTMDEELATYEPQSGRWFTSGFGPAQYDEWTDIIIRVPASAS